MDVACLLLFVSTCLIWLFRVNGKGADTDKNDIDSLSRYDTNMSHLLQLEARTTYLNAERKNAFACDLRCRCCNASTLINKLWSKKHIYHGA